MLFSLFTGGNEKLQYKELVANLIGTARSEIAKNWKKAQELSLQAFTSRIWHTMLMEKMTNKVRVQRGEISHSKFTENWKPLLKYADKIETCGLKRNLDCWSIFL